MVNCGVTCLSLILEVQLYDSGVGKDKSLAFKPKIRAKIGNSSLFIRKSRQTACANPKFRAKRGKMVIKQNKAFKIRSSLKREIVH